MKVSLRMVVVLICATSCQVSGVGASNETTSTTLATTEPSPVTTKGTTDITATTEITTTTQKGNDSETNKSKNVTKSMSTSETVPTTVPPTSDSSKAITPGLNESESKNTGSPSVTTVGRISSVGVTVTTSLNTSAGKPVSAVTTSSSLEMTTRNSSEKSTGTSAGSTPSETSIGPSTPSSSATNGLDSTGPTASDTSIGSSTKSPSTSVAVESTGSTPSETSIGPSTPPSSATNGLDSTGPTASDTSIGSTTKSPSTSVAAESTVDPCSNVECDNGGTCAGGKCECIPGFTGVDCSTDIDECESNPCSDPPRYCKDNPGGYECLCLPAFYEETETKECKKAKQQFKAELKFAEITVGNQKINSSQIFTNPNSIEAKEKKDKVMKAVEIELQQIFVGNDSISGVKVTNLRKGSLIVDFILYFVNRTSNDTELKKNLQEIIEAKLSECTDDNTTCNFGNITGFVLNSLNTTVVDFCNEYLPCDLQTTNCNTSLNTGTYSCNCKDGFQRYPPERGITDACQDIDECITGQHACGKLKCINTPGSYQCECKYGEYRDPDTDKCIDVCSGVTCNDKGTCVRDKSTFFCRCQHGHTGRECEATDSQAQTQAITLYAVAGGVGGLALIFLIGMITACVGSARKKSSSPDYAKTPFLYNNSFYGNNTDVSIPRPKFGAEMIENGGIVDDKSQEYEELDDHKPQPTGENRGDKSDDREQQERARGRDGPAESSGHRDSRSIFDQDWRDAVDDRNGQGYGKDERNDGYGKDPYERYPGDGRPARGGPSERGDRYARDDRAPRDTGYDVPRGYGRDGGERIRGYGYGDAHPPRNDRQFSVPRDPRDLDPRHDPYHNPRSKTPYVNPAYNPDSTEWPDKYF